MKIFISHQQADSGLAAAIARRLSTYHSIESYLDVIDPDTSKKGDDLGEHIRGELGQCTQLLAVVSVATKSSWWVPWEIGLATEKDFPIATYAGDTTAIPEYLKKWPYLKNDAELDIYANISKSADSVFRGNKRVLEEAVARRSGTRLFYRELRSRLGQT